MSKATAIYFGADTDIDTYDSGDEIDIFYVYAGDDDAEPIGKVYTSRNFKRMRTLAENMAAERKLELVID